MANIVKVLKLETLDFYKTHLSIINCLLPIKLTPKEIEVLALFMLYDEYLTEDKFGKKVKKLIREKLQITHQGLSNYISSLINKKMLSITDEKMKILPFVMPEEGEQSYMIKIVNVEAFPTNMM